MSFDLLYFLFSDFVKNRKKSIIGRKPIIRKKSINRKSSIHRKHSIHRKNYIIRKKLLIEKFYYKKKSNIRQTYSKKL